MGSVGSPVGCCFEGGVVVEGGGGVVGVHIASLGERVGSQLWFHLGWYGEVCLQKFGEIGGDLAILTSNLAHGLSM